MANRELYRDENGLLRYRTPTPPGWEPKRWEPGTPMTWNRTIPHIWDTEPIPVTVVKDKGSWVVVLAEDGEHRVKRHNLERRET